MCTNDVKIKLFSTFCSSMYTAQLWWNHSVYSIHRLHVCYTNVFRRLLGLPRYCSASAMFAERLTPDCKAVIQNLVYKFMSHLDKSRNSLKKYISDDFVMLHIRVMLSIQSALLNRIIDNGISHLLESNILAGTESLPIATV